jgi:hypothetical protein
LIVASEPQTFSRQSNFLATHLQRVERTFSRSESSCSAWCGAVLAD